MFSIEEDDLLKIASAAVNPDEQVKIVSQQLEPFSKTRHGIMGNHYILKLELEDEATATRRSLQFFVKTPPESTTLRDSLVDEWVSLEEVHFFEKVYPVLMKNYRGKRWCPRCYLAKPELLVFEDLRSQGLSIRRDSIYDEQSLKSALSTLARFHASSIIAENVFLPTKALNQVYSQAFREKIFTDLGKGARSNKLGFDTLQLLAKRFNLDHSILPDILARLCQLVKPSSGSCNVICHGDLWRTNIMFDDTKTPAECVLVDYQMLRYASPSVDVAVLMYVHTRPEFRANSELRMLQHYHTTFRGILTSHNLENAIPTYESFAHDYQQRKLLGMACSCMRWPKIVFDEILNNPAALKKWYFENRIDLYVKAIDDDPNFARIIRDNLVELIDEGKRVLNVQ